MVCRRVWLAGDGGKSGTGLQQPSAEERARTAIFSNSWGEAAAVDFYGPRYGLPQAISKHNSYWIWGPRDYDGSTMIFFGADGRHEPEQFRSVQDVGRVEHPYSRRDEYFDIYLCRGLKENLKDLWPKLKVLIESDKRSAVDDLRLGLLCESCPE